MVDLREHQKGSKTHPGGNHPYVSVQEKRIGIPASLMRKHFSGVEHVVFLHDAQTGVEDGATTLAIKPADESEANAYKIHDTGSTGSIHAKSLIDECKIEKSRYEAEWDNENGYLVVDLKSKVE